MKRNESPTEEEININSLFPILFHKIDNDFTEITLVKEF
jgi:hypothetical protein